MPRAVHGEGGWDAPPPSLEARSRVSQRPRPTKHLRLAPLPKLSALVLTHRGHYAPSAKASSLQEQTRDDPDSGNALSTCGEGCIPTLTLSVRRFKLSPREPTLPWLCLKPAASSSGNRCCGRARSLAAAPWRETPWDGQAQSLLVGKAALASFVLPCRGPTCELPGRPL